MCHPVTEYIYTVSVNQNKKLLSVQEGQGIRFQDIVGSLCTRNDGNSFRGSMCQIPRLFRFSVEMNKLSYVYYYIKTKHLAKCFELKFSRNLIIYDSFIKYNIRTISKISARLG